MGKTRCFFKKAISCITAAALVIPIAAQSIVSAEEPEKYPYAMFGRNGISITADSNICVNGAIHTNKEAAVSYLNGNINGRITTGADIEKRVKHVYSDTKIKETHFSENVDLHEEEYEYSDLNIHINNPLFCYNNLFLANIPDDQCIKDLCDIIILCFLVFIHIRASHTAFTDIFVKGSVKVGMHHIKTAIPNKLSLLHMTSFPNVPYKVILSHLKNISAEIGK